MIVHPKNTFDNLSVRSLANLVSMPLATDIPIRKLQGTILWRSHQIFKKFFKFLVKKRKIKSLSFVKFYILPKFAYTYFMIFVLQ